MAERGIDPALHPTKSKANKALSKTQKPATPRQRELMAEHGIDLGKYPGKRDAEKAISQARSATKKPKKKRAP
jgi:hypothetical protein